MHDLVNLESMFGTVKAELVKLLEERDDAIRHRAEIEQQVAGLKQVVSGLLHYSKGQRDKKLASTWSAAFRALLDRAEDASPALTLSDACLRAFQTSSKSLCATDLKAYLEDGGYSFEAYKSNPLSSIHTVLKRLAGASKIVEDRTEGTTTYYRAAGRYSWPDTFDAVGAVTAADNALFTVPGLAGEAVAGAPQFGGFIVPGAEPTSDLARKLVTTVVETRSSGKK